MSGFNVNQLLSFLGTFASPGLGASQGGPCHHHRHHHWQAPGRGSGSGSASGGSANQFSSQLQRLQSQMDRLLQDMQGMLGGQQGAFGMGPFGQSNGWQSGDMGTNAGCPFNQSPWSVTNQGNGQDHIDLPNYTLDLNKSNMQWTLTNKETGVTTNVSGDPHVSEAGNNWDFKHDTTFQLQDGTRITVHTEPWGNSGATVSSSLDITRGGHGMRVTGLGGPQDGQLQVADGLNGYELDAGNLGTQVLFESGSNWQTFAGENVNRAVATQQDL